MEKLTDTLFRLLYDGEFRKIFEAERLWEKEEFRDFATIDWKQLGQFGQSIERNLFEEGLVATKSLSEAFPLSLKELGKAGIDYRREFPLSPEFGVYSDMNHGLGFLSLEEAFYRFVVAKLPASELLARQDFLALHFQSLAVHNNPAFSVNPDFARPIVGGFASLQRFGEETRLFAALSGKFISGPLEAELAEIFRLYILEGAPQVAAAHEEAVSALESLGFALPAPIIQPLPLKQ